jgi:hypothetical protein
MVQAPQIDLYSIPARVCLDVAIAGGVLLAVVTGTTSI